MSTEEKKAVPELSAEVLALAKKLEAGIKIDKATGIGAEEGDLYKTNLPEGLTSELVKSVSTYNGNFVAAGAYAFGKLAVEAMASNKKLDVATVELKLGGRDKVDFTVQRSKEYTNHLAGTGEKTLKYGVVTPTLEIRAGKNSGQLKAARQLIGELAMKKLK